MTGVLGIIPASYENERFPGRALKKIGSRTILQRVHDAASRCPELDKIVIGTDDERIRESAASFGAEVLMTSEAHRTGTDRLAEVADYYKDYDVIVNIQGKFPGVASDLISGVVKMKLENEDVDVATAARPFRPDEDPLIPQKVKVALTRKHRALYFSRSMIPFPRHNTELPIYHHIGIYAYSRDFLMRFNTLPRSGLEETEQLELLRVLENDYSMGVHLVDDAMPGVDTPEDLQRLIGMFKSRGLLD